MKDTYRNQLTAADLMHAEVVTVFPTTTLGEAAHRMVENHVSGLPVVDAHHRCLGVISATDIMRFVDQHAARVGNPAKRFTKFFDETSHRWEYLDFNTFFTDDLRATEVAEVMTREPLFVSPWTPISEVAQQMFDNGVHRILVLGEGYYLKGIISSLDFVRIAAAMECVPA